ncbi:unnamed protein product [Closterium sp. Yama58-4]|nr:unnamed protein product [Closterium sp. Yama58-4]
MNVGGKALTNVLKEVVSYRAWNMMDETLIMDHAKEQLCFVSLFPTRHLPLARKRDASNIFRAEYLLPDGVTLLRGQVKDRAAAMRAVKAQEELWEQHMAEELSLASERFMVPEGLFHPSDLGVSQAGLAETIVAAVNAAPPVIHPLIYSNIVLVGGSCQFPFFKERLALELRPLVPESLPVNISLSQSPVVSAWKGGSELVKSGEFARKAVTKKQYEELGYDRVSELFKY